MLLRRGSQGAEVKWVQSALNKAKPSQFSAGMSFDQLTIDGLFGPRTDARTREFQKNHQLKVDGIVGPNTKAKLAIYNVGNIPTSDETDKKPIEKSNKVIDLPSNEEIKRQIEEKLGRKFSSLPKKFESNLDTALRWLKTGNSVLKFGTVPVAIAELVVAEWALLKGTVAGGAVVAAAPAVALLGGFLSLVGGVFAVMYAWETNLRMYGCRAIAYTTTAWAFGDPIPSQSKIIIGRLTVFNSPETIKEYHDAWRKASLKTRQNLDDWAQSTAAKHDTTPAALKLAIQANSQGKRLTLCNTLMNQFDGKFSGLTVSDTVTSSWKEGKKVTYPR